MRFPAGWRYLSDQGQGRRGLPGVEAIGWSRVLEGLLDSVLVMDPEGIIRFANRATHVASVDALVGRPLAELMLPEDREGVQAIHRQVLEGGEPAVYQRVYRPGPEVERIYEVRVSRLAEDGVVLGLLACGSDITERVQMEERSLLLQRVLVLVPEAVLLISAHSKRLLAVNQATAQLYGHSAEVLLTMTLRELEAKPGASRREQARTIAGSGGALENCWHRRRDGTVFPVEVSTSPFSQGDREVELHLVRDIGPMLELQESLQQSRDLLLAKNELLEQKNAALRELIEQVRSERERVGARVQANVASLVLPHLDRLRARLQPGEFLELELLECNLRELTSTFGSRITSLGARLSPREVEVCNHIRQGRTTKQIAATLGLSSQSVSVHRRNIRRKLELTHRGVNLRTFLEGEIG